MNNSKPLATKSPSAIAAPTGSKIATNDVNQNAANPSEAQQGREFNGLLCRCCETPQSVGSFRSLPELPPAAILLQHLIDASFRSASNYVAMLRLRDRPAMVRALLEECDRLEAAAGAGQLSLEPESASYAVDAAIFRYVASCLVERERSFRQTIAIQSASKSAEGN